MTPLNVLNTVVSCRFGENHNLSKVASHQAAPSMTTAGNNESRNHHTSSTLAPMPINHVDRGTPSCNSANVDHSMAAKTTISPSAKANNGVGKNKAMTRNIETSTIAVAMRCLSILNLLSPYYLVTGLSKTALRPGRKPRYQTRATKYL